MRKRNRLWSFALAGALAVSNLSAVASPFTSFVSYAATTPAMDTLGVALASSETDAANFVVVETDVCDVNSTAKIQFPAYTLDTADTTWGIATAPSTGDKFQLMATYKGGTADPFLITVSDTTYGSSGELKTTAVDEYVISSMAGKTLVISAWYIPNGVTDMTSTNIKKKDLVEVNVKQQAAGSDLKTAVTFGENIIGTVDNPFDIAANYGTKPSGKFIRSDAKFAIELNSAGTAEGAAGTQTKGKWGEATKTQFTAAKAGTFTVKLTYDPDGDTGTAPAEYIDEATVTVESRNLIGTE